MTPAQVRRFRALIRAHYRNHRSNLPWRNTDNPYYILVSEVMLQQTQVARVLVKYESFLRRFPTIHSLAGAPFRDVLAEWQGMGYNRRAKALKDLSRLVVRDYGGKIPGTEEALCSFPGIGRATARAILAFAFNKPSVFIETNIRTVYIHCFFKGASLVSDPELVPFIEGTLDRKNPREWYYALMDFGVFLKQRFPELLAKSKHYVKQSRFEGSRRQIRGMILKLTSAQGSIDLHEIARVIPKNKNQLKSILKELVNEGFLVKCSTCFRIVE